MFLSYQRPAASRRPEAPNRSFCLLLLLLPLIARADANVTVDGARPISAVSDATYGVHTSVYDNQNGNASLPGSLIESGVNTLRYSGGGYADVYHWAVHKLSPWGWDGSYGYLGPNTDFGKFVALLDNAQAQAVITINFGSGQLWNAGHTQLVTPATNASPQEAAAWVAYANASTNTFRYGTTNDLALGTDSLGNDWKTVGFWAKLRSSTLAQYQSWAGTNYVADYNFLAINHPAPADIKYWEIGNETFGTGYYDGGEGYSVNYAVPYDGTERLGHPSLSPAEYGRQVKIFSEAMKAVDPTIEIGAVLSTPPDDYSWDVYGGVHWNPQVLSQCASNVDFVIAHWYPYTGEQADGSNLLWNVRTKLPLMVNGTSSGQDTGANAGLRDWINAYRPADGTNVGIFITEFNYFGSLTNTMLGPGNAVFAGDAYATWMDLGVANVDYLEMNKTPFLGEGSALTRGAVFYAIQTVRKMAAPGDTLIKTTSSQALLRAHAALQQDGDLGLLFVNADLTNSQTVSVTISNLNVATSGIRYSFGRTNFPASNETPSAPASTNAVSGLGSSFSVTVPAFTLVALVIPVISNAPPLAPTGLTAAPGNAQVQLAWNAAVGADSYTVKRALVSGGPYTNLVSGLAVAGYTDTGVSNGTTYYYVVSATNTFGGSANSAEASATPSATPSDLMALYALEGNALDTSGHGFNGTANNLSYVAGTIGAQAAQFNGSSAYVQIPRCVTNDFTVALWIRTTSTGGTGTQWWSGLGIVDGEVNGGGADWGTAVVNGRFALGVGSTGGDTTISSSASINNGAWHHVAATRNNTSGAMMVYVDGVPSGSGTGPTGSRTAPPNLRLGSLQTGSGYLNGTLDDVRLYSRVLSAAEIAALAGGSPPAAPGSLAATAGDGQVALSWAASSGATGYYVKRSTTSGGTYLTIATNASASLAFTNNGLSNGTLYYFVVSALNASGESANSTEASARPLPPLPAAPANLVATAGNAQVSLSWNAVAGATNYFVKRALVSGGSYSSIATNGTSLAFLDTGLPNGTNYYYVVSAANLAGEGANSAEASARPLPPLPAAPANLVATAGNAQVSLSWNAVAGATNYFVKRALVSGGSYSTIATNGTSLAFLDTGLANGTNYYYVVSAANLAGEGANSAEASARPLPPLPAVPTGLIALAGDGQVALIWASSSGATGYCIKRSAADGGPYQAIATNAASLAFTNTGLSNGTLYFFVVSALNLAGESADSAQASARPVSLVPPQLVLARAGSQLQLSWPADHIGWQLEAQTNSPAEGIGTLWSPVSGSVLTNQWTMPLDTANGCVFFRLFYPISR